MGQFRWGKDGSGDRFTRGSPRYGGKDLPKPSAVLMAYTAHSDHSFVEPRTFVVVGGRDGISPPSAMQRRVKALREVGAEVEYHLYNALEHGFGLGTGTEAEGWISDAIRFWEYR